jgi:hypothetical protein
MSAPKLAGRQFLRVFHSTNKGHQTMLNKATKFAAFGCRTHGFATRLCLRRNVLLDNLLLRHRQTNNQ